MEGFAEHIMGSSEFRGSFALQCDSGQMSVVMDGRPKQQLPQCPALKTGDCVGVRMSDGNLSFWVNGRPAHAGTFGKFEVPQRFGVSLTKEGHQVCAQIGEQRILAGLNL